MRITSKQAEFMGITTVKLLHAYGFYPDTPAEAMLALESILKMHNYGESVASLQEIQEYGIKEDSRLYMV